MINLEFEHEIRIAEIKSSYLTLSDNVGRARGKTRGGEFKLVHGQELVILDAQGRETSAKFHQATQIWGGLKSWFLQNSIEEGARIRIRFDSTEIVDTLPVIHLEPLVDA